MRHSKDALVNEYLERVGSDVLASEHFRAIVRGMIKGHAGVYALYKNEIVAQGRLRVVWRRTVASPSAAAKAVVGRAANG